LEHSDEKYLSEICRDLFAQVEEQHQLLQTVLGGSDLSSLTGLKELYVNGDAETIWGQVELQNNALIRPLLKKSIKKLSSTAADNIVLLDMEEIESSSEDEMASKSDSGDADDSDDNDNADDSDDDDADDSDDNDDADDSDHEKNDEETERIKNRMARAMIDMEDEDEEDLEDGSEESIQNTAKKDDEVVDPARDDMLDGFFDLHEMEAFADEEEEYLPEVVFGQEEKEDDQDEQTEKISFHERQRRGDNILNDDDDDDDDDELVLRQTSTRRRKYRPEDEVRALLKIYDAPESQKDDEAADLTAADLFGPPDSSARKKWLGKAKSSQIELPSGFDDDADSWDNHDFNEGKATGWNEPEEQEMDKSDASDDEEEDQASEVEQNSVPAPKNTTSNNKLLKQTTELEKEMLAEKPWQMKGETQGKARPMNSLLESTPEFETATKAAPIITVQHTIDIEETIKRRILSEEWDDVVPRELPDVGWNQKRGDELPEVSQLQSKLGLGEIYEREYLKKAAGFDVDKAEKETEETKAKNEMTSLFASLCGKLDALSNYHFAPRPISDEVEIRPVSTPAIAMEEVLPMHVSNARGVAPEEVFAADKCRGTVLTGDSELTQDERKQRRNSKKAARRKARKEKLADEKLVSRLQPSSIHNPYEKRKMREELQMARSKGKVTMGVRDQNDGYGKSATFFQKLQNEVSQSVSQLDKDNLRKRKLEGVTTESSSRHKL